MQTGSTSSTPNQWVHVTVSVDKTNSNVKFYQNGNLINTFTDVPILMNNSIGGGSGGEIKSKQWRLKVLSLTLGANTSHKITPGDSYAVSRTTHMGCFRTTEIALSESDGTFIEPSNIKISNSEGETLDPAPTMQDNVYNANQFNGVWDNLLHQYYHIDYTFSEEKQIEEVHIGTTGDPQNGGFPVDMELYYSLDEGSTWLKQGGFTYNTGDLMDVDNYEVTLAMHHGNGKHIIKYKADENRWYFDKVEGGNGSKTNVTYNRDTFPSLVDNPVAPEQPYTGGGLGSLESMLVGSSVMTNKAFKGHMDDVTIHEETLTDAQVSAVYNASYASYVPTIPLNQWSHVAVNHNKHNKKLDMYINGSLCGTYENFEGNIVDNDNDIKLGENLSGEISETVLFQRPLIKKEILALATDTKRHEKAKELVSVNFATTNPISSGGIINNSSEADFTLTSAAILDTGYTSGSKALTFDGTQVGSLALSDSFVFDNMVLQANIKPTTATGTQQSIVKVDGAFNWYIGTDGKPTLTMDGDSTEYKMDSVLKDNKFASLELKVDKFNNKISFKGEKEGEWVLIMRDIVNQPTNDGVGTTINNFGTPSEDLSSAFSLLADLRDGTGDMTDENIKVGGNYKFRLVPYEESETYSDAPFGTRYMEWSQTANPILTETNGDAGYENNLIVVPNDYKTQYDEHATGNPFEGLAKSGNNQVWLDGERNSGQYQYGIGFNLSSQSSRNFMYGNDANDMLYKHPHKTELWIWKGEKEPEKNPSPNFVPSLTLPIVSGGPQLSAFEQQFGTGWQLIMELPGTDRTWFDGSGLLVNQPGDEFLFTNSDFSHWLISSHHAAIGENYSNGDREVKRSSANSSPHTVRWYNRSTEPVDPQISLLDHADQTNNQYWFYVEGHGDRQFLGCSYENHNHCHCHCHCFPMRLVGSCPFL